MSETSKNKPAAARERGRYRHVVLLGDALLVAYSSIDQRPGKFEEAVLPGTRDQWKLSVISVAEVERAGPSLALPRDATHAMIFIEGNHAIEQSGLLDSRPDTFGQTLEQLVPEVHVITPARSDGGVFPGVARLLHGLRQQV